MKDQKSHSKYSQIKPRHFLGKNILILDDERALAKALKKAFTIAGYDAGYSTSAEEAIEVVNREPKDLLIVDLALPGINGIDFIKIVKAKEATSKIPIIVYSGFTEISSASLKGLSVDKIVSKPCDLNKLIGYADELLNIEC